jgi:hypothetical protein
MQNQVRRKLEQGNNLLGMMHFTGSPMLIEVMASAGMDFVNRHGAQSDRHRAGGASHPRRRRCGNRTVRARPVGRSRLDHEDAEPRRAGNYHPPRHAGGLRGGRRCRALRARR